MGFLIVAIQSATSTFFARRGVVPSENGAFLGSREFFISERGMQVRRSGSETIVEWQAVQDFTSTPYHFLYDFSDLKPEGAIFGRCRAFRRTLGDSVVVSPVLRESA